MCLIEKIVLFVLIIVLLIDDGVSFESKYKIAKTKDGLVRGQLKKTALNGRSYYSYRGIPFAETPVGDLRFKAPEPSKPWAPKILDAFEYGSACWQPKNEDLATDISEDCLFLNVFVPVVNTTKKLPVLFHIFGGAFLKNAGDDFLCGPDFLIEHDVIVVTSNHRLGIFGFLSLDTPEYSGNMALKDQQLALKWTYENIRNFNGDRKRITISGHSSGSISANYHLTNPESRKYISRYIAMSGTANGFNGITYEKHLCEVYDVARNATQSVNSFEDLIDYLKTASARDLQKLTKQPEFPRLKQLRYAPVIEIKDAIRPFIIEPISTTYDKNKCIKIPTLFSFTNSEYLSSLRMPEFELDELNSFIENIDIPMPINEFNITRDESMAYRQMLTKLSDHYFANATNHFEKSMQYIQLYSDLGYMSSFEEMINYHAQNPCQNTYVYEFNVDSTLNLEKFGVNITLPGSAHVDDQYYIFWSRPNAEVYKKIIETKDTDPQSQICLRTIHYLTTILTNFIKNGRPIVNGNPTKEFNPIRPNAMHFLQVTNDGLTFQKSSKRLMSSFLRQILIDAAILMYRYRGNRPLYRIEKLDECLH